MCMYIHLKSNSDTLADKPTFQNQLKYYDNSFEIFQIAKAACFMIPWTSCLADHMVQILAAKQKGQNVK